MIFLRGALIELMPLGLIPIPNIIAFQYNPESMSHAWTQPEPVHAGPNQTTTNPLAVNGNPGESFTFTLFLDAADEIADGGLPGGLASISGVYSRLAAMEMLLFPASNPGGNLTGTVTAAAGGAAGGVKRPVPAYVMNTVLFVWGPGRIVPVRVTSLTIIEKLYDSLLNPTKAEVQITLRVLTNDELNNDKDSLAFFATTANSYTQGLREVLAVANLANVSSFIGTLSQ